jgi:Protein of unknown function (DUF4100)
LLTKKKKDSGKVIIYTRDHWARVTTETLVQIEHLEDPVIALVDTGSEINIMSNELFDKGDWPVDMNGWMMQASNNSKGSLWGPNLAQVSMSPSVI